MTVSLAPTYCVNHPTVETGLRCIKCDRYICVKCAVRTPTGYSCRDCVRTHQKVFDTAVTRDYLIVFFLGGLLSFCGAIVISLISSLIWGLIVIILAPGAGALIGNILRRIVKGHHSRKLNWTLLVAVVLGGLPVLLFSLLPGLMYLFVGPTLEPMTTISIFGSVIWQIVYLVLAVPSAYAQFAGIRLVR